MSLGISPLRPDIENTPDGGEKLAARGADGRPHDSADARTAGASTNTVELRKAGETSRPKDDPRKVAEAAREFESLLLAQILRMVREAGGSGWLGSGESHQMSSTMELAETQLARAMAQSGALGISKMLATELPADSGGTAKAAPENGEASSVGKRTGPLERGRG